MTRQSVLRCATRGRILILAALALGLLACPAAAEAGGSPAAHQSEHKLRQRPTYWGAWIGDQITGEEPPWDMSATSSLAGLLGKGLSLVEFSSPLADCSERPCSYYGFPTEEMERIRAYGAIPFFSWSTSSNRYDETNFTDPGFQLRDIISGAYDRQITEFATAAAAWGHPFFLRLNWEMNGNWFPWAEGENGNAAGEYVAAWRHVHDIFTSVGATNATWVWCPYVDIEHRFQSLRSLYPGNAYVDWTSLDGFNWAQNPANPQKWRSFDQIFSSTYAEVTKKIAPKKPMILAEMASTGSPPAKSKWIRRMFEMLRTKYRRIRGLIWFDKVDRGVSWPLETSQATVRAFAQGIHAPGFRQNHYWELPPEAIRPPG